MTSTNGSSKGSSSSRKASRKTRKSPDLVLGYSLVLLPQAGLLRRIDHAPPPRFVTMRMRISRPTPIPGPSNQVKGNDNFKLEIWMVFEGVLGLVDNKEGSDRDQRGHQ